MYLIIINNSQLLIGQIEKIWCLSDWEFILQYTTCTEWLKDKSQFFVIGKWKQWKPEKRHKMCKNWPKSKSFCSDRIQAISHSKNEKIFLGPDFFITHFWGNILMIYGHWHLQNSFLKPLHASPLPGPRELKFPADSFNEILQPGIFWGREDVSEVQGQAKFKDMTTA